MDLSCFITSLCARHGIPATPQDVREVLAARARIHGEAIAKPREDAALTLQLIKAAGKRTAIISNCTSDIPRMLSDGALAELVDVAVYSFDEGIAKPDPEIYRRACERLGVSTERCLYVGDGSDHELRGAAEAGMLPVLLETDEWRDHSGPRVRTLLEVADALVS